MNVGKLFARAANYYAEQTAVIEDDDLITYKKLNARVNRLANKLLEYGLQKGDRAAILLKNCRQYIEIYLALQKTGIIAVPLNILLTAHEHRFVLKDSGAVVIFYGDYFSDEVAKDLLPGSNLKTLIMVAGNRVLTNGIISYESIIGQGSESEPPIEILPDDLCTLNYTSGTTGKPKGVMLSNRNWVAVYRNLLLDRDIKPGDHLAVVGPLTHSAGSYVMPHFIRGGTVNIIPGGFNVERLLEAIAKSRVSSFSCVPTMLIRFMSEASLKNHDLSSLRNIAYGAAPMPVEKIKEAVRTFGPVLSQNYGQTEAYMTICHLQKHQHVIDGSEKATKRLASVGRPYTLVEVKIVDNDGNNIQQGEKGELIVRSDHVMCGYWNQPDETKAVLKNGWLHTGDIAQMDEDGFIYLVGRKKDLIISGGFNIYPREVEEVLYRHDGVVDAAVVGVPDEEWGEAVCAFIVPKTGVNLNNKVILEFCKPLLGFKKPRYIYYLNDLPKGPTGKIDKSALLSLVLNLKNVIDEEIG